MIEFNLNLPIDFSIELKEFRYWKSVFKDLILSKEAKEKLVNDFKSIHWHCFKEHAIELLEEIDDF